MVLQLLIVIQIDKVILVQDLLALLQKMLVQVAVAVVQVVLEQYLLIPL